MIDRFSWVAIYPEIVLLVMACVIALADLHDAVLADAGAGGLQVEDSQRAIKGEEHALKVGKTKPRPAIRAGLRFQQVWISAL